MKGFFVGARVRIKRCPLTELVGQEGRIVGGKGHRPELPYRPSNQWHVAPDCWGTDRLPASAVAARGLDPRQPVYFVPDEADLEPIAPPGAAAGTMSYKELMESLQEKEKV